MIVESGSRAPLRPLGPGGRRRISPRPDDEHERRLVAADHDGRAAAADRVADHFMGFRLDQVERLGDEATMALLAVAPSSLEELNALVRLDLDLLASDLPVPRMRLANGSQPPPVAQDLGVVLPPRQEGDPTTVQPFVALRELTSGTTLILNNITSREAGPLRVLAHDLSRVTGTRVQVNAYLSERDAVGFGRHWDDHDVMIIQCVGRKHWEVYAPAALSPIPGYVDKDAFGDPVFATVLEPGDGLYIPRGWGHRVGGFEGELAVHLTCGMRRMTGLDFIQGLARGRDSMRPAVREDGDLDMSTFVAAAVDDEVIEDIYGEWRARATPLQEIGPLELWQAQSRLFEGWTVSSPAIGGVAFYEAADLGSSEIGLSSVGSDFAIGRDWVEPYARLVAGDVLRVADIADLVPDADRRDAAAWVVDLGARSLITLRRDVRSVMGES